MASDAHALRMLLFERWRMSVIYDINARKRAVNLSLNEDLAIRARQVTGNLSAAVEALLADFVAQEEERHAAKASVLREAAAAWNRFTEQHGSFADEHSTL
ncbi:type II toxin-antitoxin system CcdA family antitoxin [Algiphilus sp. W345]|uniref:Type II toxin-antitoxin system CcdA family antitoxin n=1 Tax=Banduia mediterranea TaxID=3075609 RepID=A0ABU2WQG7_9GAMM|nr:type II toxin-antitoxin system CcdA family antitoxin [Algiphilus sp. W345]MDT0499272.1 type II toxin-antitoxin system CcdA family antitoxin [Algiphilus sp. W345]